MQLAKTFAMQHNVTVQLAVFNSLYTDGLT